MNIYKGDDTMRIVETIITPEIAAKALANNPTNRPIKKRNLWEISEDLKAGRWKFDGSPIRVSITGELLDGQHRLLAVVNTGVPMRTVVIYDLPNDVRRTIDGGAKRSLGDRLGMSGVLNANAVAAAINFMYQIAVGTVGNAMPAAEAQEVFDANPGIANSASVARQAFPKMGAKLSAIHYIGTIMGDGEAADSFVSVFKTGIPAYENDPAQLLRERIIRSRDSQNKIGEPVLKKLTVRAWILHRDGDNTGKRLIVPQTLKIPGWTLEFMKKPK